MRTFNFCGVLFCALQGDSEAARMSSLMASMSGPSQRIQRASNSSCHEKSRCCVA